VSKSRTVIRILNPEAEAAEFTSLNRARRFVRKGKAKWEGDAIRFIADSERRIVRNEIACRWRGIDEATVDRAVLRSRYSQINWSASKNSFRAPWENPAIVMPGICRS
jgi:hypothetical protein